MQWFNLPLLIFPVCSWQWLLSRCGIRYWRPFPRCGDFESPVPTEEQGVCTEQSQRGALEWTHQCSRTVRHASWRGWVPFDWLYSFWRDLAWLRVTLQGLPEAVRESTERRNKPLSNRHGLRDLFMVLGKTEWSASQKSQQERCKEEHTGRSVT